MVKTRYWKKFKENYPLVIPSTFTMAIGVFLIWTYMYFSLEFVKTISSDSGQVLALLVLVTSFFKLLGWIGYDVLNNWADKMGEALTR